MRTIGRQPSHPRKKHRCRGLKRKEPNPKPSSVSLGQQQRVNSKLRLVYNLCQTYVIVCARLEPKGPGRHVGNGV
ncbi:unnamed protein product [Merluccius merluccius]